MSEPIIYGVEWAAVEVHDPHVARWNIYEVFGTSEDGAWFTKWDDNGSPQPVESLDETESWATLTIKWDGCSHLDFKDDAAFHICGYPAWVHFHEVITDLFKRSVDVLKAKGVAYVEEDQFGQRRRNDTR